MNFDNNGIDLKLIASIVIKKWKTIAIIALAALILTYGYVAFLAKPKYQSTVSYYVNNSSSSSIETHSFTTSDLTGSLLITSTYAEIASSNELMIYLAEKLDNQYPYQQLKSWIRVSCSDENQLLYIRVITGSIDRSYEIANAVMTYLMPRVKEIVGSATIEPLGTPIVNNKPVSPNVTRSCAIGLIVGILLGIAFVLVMNVTNNKITDPDEFVKRFSIPVLGEIPDAMTMSKGGYSSKYEQE